MADGVISRVRASPRDMYLRIYNPDARPLTGVVAFEAGTAGRWSTTVTVPPHARLNVPVQGIVPVPAEGASIAFGAKVTFEPGRVGAVSFLVFSSPTTLYLYMNPTLFCSVPQ